MKTTKKHSPELQKAANALFRLYPDKEAVLLELIGVLTVLGESKRGDLCHIVERTAHVVVAL